MLCLSSSTWAAAVFSPRNMALRSLVRAIPRRLVEWVKTALQNNLRKEQLISPWQTDDHAIGALDGLLRKVEWLEGLKREMQRRHAGAHGRTFSDGTA